MEKRSQAKGVTRSEVVFRGVIAWMRKMSVVTWLVLVQYFDMVVTTVRARPARGCISYWHLRITVDGGGRPQWHDVPLLFSMPAQAQ